MPIPAPGNVDAASQATLVLVKTQTDTIPAILATFERFAVISPLWQYAGGGTNTLTLTALGFFLDGINTEAIKSSTMRGNARLSTHNIFIRARCNTSADPDNKHRLVITGAGTHTYNMTIQAIATYCIYKAAGALRIDIDGTNVYSGADANTDFGIAFHVEGDGASQVEVYSTYIELI